MTEEKTEWMYVKKLTFCFWFHINWPVTLSECLSFCFWILKIFMLLQLLFFFQMNRLEWNAGHRTAKFTFGNSWLGWNSTGDNAFVVCSPSVDRNPKRENWHCCHHFLANRNQEHLVKMIDIELGICLMRSLVHRNWNTAMFALDDNMENSCPYLQHPTDYPMIPVWNDKAVFFFHSITKLILCSIDFCYMA